MHFMHLISSCSLQLQAFSTDDSTCTSLNASVKTPVCFIDVLEGVLQEKSIYIDFLKAFKIISIGSYIFPITSDKNLY